MDKNGKEKMLEKVEKKAVKKAAKKAVKKDVKQGKYSSVSHMAIRESAYLRTILDAVNNVGVKIPDEVTTPSFTVQVLTKFVVTSNTGAGGNTGCGFWRILGGSSAAVGQSTLAASATANQYAATGLVNPWATQFNTQCASMRLVSAKCTMTYLGSPNNASGRFLIAFISPYNLMSTVSGNVALSGVGAGQNLLANDKLVDVPASKLYAECRYVPLDPIARSYETSGSTAYGTLRGSGNLTYGQFIGILDGCPVSQNVEVNIWENLSVFHRLILLISCSPRRLSVTHWRWRPRPMSCPLFLRCLRCRR